jgi:hypothetical protein
MTKRHFEWAAKYVREGKTPAGLRLSYTEQQAVRDAFYYLFSEFGPRFDGGRFLHACDLGSGSYQPKTGAACTCKRGLERDNCPRCEGTGEVIDFAAIRARNRARTEEGPAGSGQEDI